MLRRMFLILFFFLVRYWSFSQSVKDAIDFQFDKIASLTLTNKEFIVSTYIGGGLAYIIKQTNDSLFVTSYVTKENNEISDVFSVLVNVDTLFSKIFDNKLFRRRVDSLYRDIREHHSYKPYSKEILAKSGDFFLTFYDKKKLQVFNSEEASLNQGRMVELIVNYVRIYSIVPFGGGNKRIEYLNIKNWNDLLKYLKSGAVDSVQPKQPIPIN